MPDGQIGRAWYGKVCHASQRFAGAPILRLDYYLNRTEPGMSSGTRPKHDFDRDFTDKLTNKSANKP